MMLVVWDDNEVKRQFVRCSYVIPGNDIPCQNPAVAVCQVLVRLRENKGPVQWGHSTMHVLVCKDHEKKLKDECRADAERQECMNRKERLNKEKLVLPPYDMPF